MSLCMCDCRAYPVNTLAVRYIRDPEKRYGRVGEYGIQGAEGNTYDYEYTLLHSEQTKLSTPSTASLQFHWHV